MIEYFTDTELMNILTSAKKSDYVLKPNIDGFFDLMINGFMLAQYHDDYIHGCKNTAIERWFVDIEGLSLDDIVAEIRIMNI